MLSLPYAINSGGPAHGNLNADVFAVSGSNTTRSPMPIGGTEDSFEFLSLRYGNSFAYNVTGLPVGDIEVTLGFAETGGYYLNQRVMAVTANGVPVLTNLDVFKEAGAQNFAILRTFKATISATGVLNLSFSANGGLNAFVNSIRLAAYVPVVVPEGAIIPGEQAKDSAARIIRWVASADITWQEARAALRALTPPVSNTLSDSVVKQVVARDLSQRGALVAMGLN